MHWQSVPVRPWLERIAGKSESDSVEIEASADISSDAAWMDPRLMELALSNLLVNAMKYARHIVHCKLMNDAGDYILTVEDDGPGIPEEAREEIFRAFTRIDDSRNRDTGGSGLGLAVVYRVAQLHGGVAFVSSSPKLGGARFSIRWPAKAD
jgi:signal transduction histidine kinase